MLFFKGRFRFRNKLYRKYRASPHTPFSTIINILNYVDTFVITDGWDIIDTLLGFTLCCTVLCFDNCIMSCIYYYSITQNSFTTLTMPCIHLFIPLFPCTPGNQSFFFYCLNSSAFRMSYSWNHKAYSFFRLAFFTQQYVCKFSQCLLPSLPSFLLLMEFIFFKQF